MTTDKTSFADRRKAMETAETTLTNVAALITAEAVAMRDAEARFSARVATRAPKAKQ
jgi:hypothetical protein